MRYGLKYSGTRFSSLKINITQFLNGFRLSPLSPKSDQLEISPYDVNS